MDVEQPGGKEAGSSEPPRLEAQLAALDKLASAYSSARAAAAEAISAGVQYQKMCDKMYNIIATASNSAGGAAAEASAWLLWCLVFHTWLGSDWLVLCLCLHDHLPPARAVLLHN